MTSYELNGGDADGPRPSRGWTLAEVIVVVIIVATLFLLLRHHAHRSVTDDDPIEQASPIAHEFLELRDNVIHRTADVNNVITGGVVIHKGGDPDAYFHGAKGGEHMAGGNPEADDVGADATDPDDVTAGDATGDETADLVGDKE